MNPDRPPIQDADKTKEELLAELNQLRQRVAELEASSIGDRTSGDADFKQPILETLASKPRLLEAVLHQMPAGVIVAEAPSGRVVLINEQVQQILRNCLPTIENVEEYIPIQYQVFSPEGQLYAPDNVPLARSLLQGEVVQEEELILVWNDGVRKECIASSTPVCDALGNITAAVLTFADITERKQVEHALRSALQRLTFHMENSPLALVEWDRNYAIARWSARAEAIFGWRAEEVLGKKPTDWKFVHPDDFEEVRQVIQRLVDRTEQRNMVRNRNFTKSGAIVYCEWYSSALFDETGEFSSVLCLVLDVTERQRAEQALLEATRRNYTILESITDGFTALDHKLRFTYLNPQGERMLEVQREAVIGRSIFEVFPDLIGSDFHAALRRVQQEKIAIHAEQFYSPLKTWFDNHMYPLEGGGICIYYQDISSTKRLEAERQRIEQSLQINRERLNLVLESSELGLWYCDLPFNKLEWNAKCKEHFGLSPTAEVTFDIFLERLHPDDRTRTQQAIDQAIQQQIPYDIDYRTVGIDGTVRWIRAIGRCFYDGSGKPIRFDGITIDATERKRQEAERERLLEREQAARSEAEAANRIKDEFLAVLSHELRTPLNPILGWSRLLRSRSLDAATVDRALETIERNARLQTQLIEDLLDVSRILQGKLTLNVSTVDLEATIASALETVRLAAEAKAIEVQFTRGDDQEKRTNTVRSIEGKSTSDPSHGKIQSSKFLVSGDASRLQQVVWNLLSNAIKFTPSGGRVEVILEPGGQSSGFRAVTPPEQPASLQAESPRRRLTTYAQIRVTDTGKGISPDFLPYVFDYFRQADSTTTRKFGGLGLGLAIVRHIVELHGGTVAVESPGEGLGATFSVKLPMIMTNQEGNQNSSQSDDMPDLNGVRVLVVDDEADSLEFHAFVLEQHGATTFTAASAEIALQVLAQSKPDILLSDIGMPEMDGYMLMRQIRTLAPEQGGQIPAIALTAYAGEYDQQQALSAGFQQHLSKPIDVNQLLETVASLIK